MKKIVLNLTDTDFEKFRLEAIYEKKSIQDVIRNRLLEKPFHEEIEEAYDIWLTLELTHIMNEE